MVAFEPEATRQMIEENLPRDVSHHGRAPEIRNLYFPIRHAQALSPDHGLVVGIRGAGKSVWWAALQSEDHRHIVAATLPNMARSEISTASAGFGEIPRPDQYPDKWVLGKLLQAGRAPVQIWRAVIAWNSWGQQEGALTETLSWEQRVAWLEDHPEETAKAFKAFDDRTFRAGRKHMVLFDAIDRSASNWENLRRLLRGLLEILLEFRAFSALRVKVFVRPDMLADPSVTNFRDATKVTATKVELRWARADLYGLLFQRLGNAPCGSDFRNGCESLGGGRWQDFQGTWQVPRDLREDEGLQRKVFDEIAGNWMGRDPRRGMPYSWILSHLADAADQVSPRSFLAAIRSAAESSRGQASEYALHYSAVRKGVQQASLLRVAEVREDFPWVPLLMEPLRGLVIPCDFGEIASRWKAARVVDGLLRDLPEGALPPKHLAEGVEGLREDLLELALFKLQRDHRVNMPDVYRVGFGLGRWGGVKTIR